MCRPGLRTACLALGLTLLCVGSAAAQAVGTATIAGTVTDSSGAAVPGVTVEAASPALTEGTRSAVSNEAGRYSIVNLRPGVYTVTFTLAGFRTQRRENVQLTSDFTAQINQQLTVGGVEETVTVEATAPVVDVQSVQQPRVFTRDQLDALPTGRTPGALLNTLPGVSAGFFSTNFRGTSDSLTMIDGMRASNLIGAGPSLTTAPSSSNVYQEFSFSTNIDNAEVGQPGLRINLVPRDGGNEVRGSVFGTYTRDDWQTSNVDDALRAQNVNDAPKTIKLWDFNPTVGGPIVRDKLWFQTTYQNNGSDVQVAGNYFDANPDPFVYVEDRARVAVNSTEGYSFVQRLAYQATQKDKIAGHYQRAGSKTPYFFSPVFGLAPVVNATLVLNVPDNDQVGGRWTRTHSSRMLFETSYLWTENNILNDYREDAAEPWSSRHIRDAGLPTVPPAPELFAVFHQNLGRQINLAGGADANVSKSWELRSAMTYVTGSHSLKAGFSLLRGSYNRPTSTIGHAVFRPNFNPALNQVEFTLPTNRIDEIDGDWAFFAQDRWTVKQLTVNAGVRLDWLKTSYPDQVLPGSFFLAEQTCGTNAAFCGDDVLDWKDLSPRLGVAYDLFGNGKTAIKVALARYVAGETVNLTGAVNPSLAIATTDRRAWTDVNGDRTIYNANGTVQANELGPSANLNFGRPIRNTNYDQDVLEGWFKRGFNWETNVSVQHELLPRVGVTGLFYRRTVGNVRLTDNLAVTPASYDSFCITGATDSRLPGGGGARRCGLADIKPSALGPTNNFVTFAETLGVERPTTVTGYEFQVNARLPRGAFLTGGVNFQNTHTDTCGIVDSPENLFCEQDTSYRPDIKLTGSYLLPYDVQISGIYSGLAGPQILAVQAAGGATISSELGRGLASGGTKNVNLIEPGTEFMPMRHVFDMRFAKIFNITRYRFQVMADLYNIFNDNGVSSINTTYGASFFSPVNQWMYATGITSPRQFRLSAQFDF